MTDWIAALPPVSMARNAIKSHKRELRIGRGLSKVEKAYGNSCFEMGYWTALEDLKMLAVEVRDDG